MRIIYNRIGRARSKESNLWEMIEVYKFISAEPRDHGTAMMQNLYQLAIL